jgi:transcriptional regulator with PAS, ATPase and Fis domain
MKNILVCWLGETDLQVLQGSDDIGPIAKATKAIRCDEVHIMSDLGPDNGSCYAKWLSDQTTSKIEIHTVNFCGQTTVRNVSVATVEVVDKIKASSRDETLLLFNQSSGGPIMRMVMFHLAKSLYFPAGLIQLSMVQGNEVITNSLEWSDSGILPSIMQRADQELERLMVGLSLEAPEFSDIVAKSPAMQKAVLMARRLAPRSVTVLIEGESGTGKELFARAIHEASPRCKMKFIPVNCGAIPAEIVAAELFGYVKGAFTGADKDHPGYFRAADGGTLFLDEVGELSAEAQVKLLRVLETRRVMPVGSREEKKVDVRIIAATNRNIGEEVTTGRFRLDLFYRLAIGIIILPPLRERRDDINLLVETLLEKVNHELEESGYQGKKLYPGARNLLIRHSWPGNVRELLNTLTRAAIWSSGEMIEEHDIQTAIISRPSGGDGVRTRSPGESIIDRPLGNGFNIQKLKAEVVRHYLKRALEQAGGSKTGAAILVGLKNHQTLSNWLKQYEVDF